MSAVPLNAKLCHKCYGYFCTAFCPRCCTTAQSIAVLTAELAPNRAPSAAPKPARGMTAPALKFPSPYADCSFLPGFKIRITGQVRGGKNGMGISQSGAHYARKPFKTWRADAVEQIRRQLPAHCAPVCAPVNVRIDYVAGDKRRRDFPAICDALWHVLEKSGVVADDALLWPAFSSRSYDKEKPGVTITFL